MTIRTQLVAALSIAALGVVAAPAWAQLPGPVQGGAERSGSAAAAGVTQDAGDSEFLLDALRTDLAEVKTAALAQQRAQNPQVREYAAKLHTDHSRSMQELEGLVKAAGLVAPTEPSADALHVYAELETRSGAEFDAAFLEHMAESHREAVEAYGEQTHANPNKSLSDFASKTLPVLREHLATAEQLQRTLAASPAAR